MKQKMKKVVAAVLAAVMVLAMSVTAFAAEEQKGNINFKTPEDVEGNVVGGAWKENTTQTVGGRKFSAYRLFNATASGKNVVYTEVKAEITTEICRAIIAVDATTTEGQAVKNNKTFENAKAWFAAQKDNAELLQKFNNEVDKSRLGTALTNEQDGIINNAPYGYYLVVEDETSSTGDDKAASLIALTTVMTANDTVIYLKAEAPTVDKVADVKTQEIGKNVVYTVTGKLPSEATLNGYDTYKYVVHDTLVYGLDFAKNPNVTLKWLDTDKNPIESAGIPNPTTNTAANDVLTVGFTDLKTSNKPNNAVYLEVQYTAVVTNDAKLNDDGNTNDVYVEYSNNPASEGAGNTSHKDVDVFTYSINILKRADDEAETPLKDAEFRLYRSTKKLAIDKSNPVYVTNTEKGYKVDQTVQKGDDEDPIINLVSDENGKIKVYGLAAGTYYLEEVKAPNGYNKLKAPIRIDIDGTTKDRTVKADGTKFAADEKNPIEVVNTTGTVLPSTGGVGTTILYVVGILAMAAAVFYFVMNKRSKEVK